MVSKFMIAGVSALCAVPVTGAIVGTVAEVFTPIPKEDPVLTIVEEAHGFSPAKVELGWNEDKTLFSWEIQTLSYRLTAKKVVDKKGNEIPHKPWEQAGEGWKFRQTQFAGGFKYELAVTPKYADGLITLYCSMDK